MTAAVPLEGAVPADRRVLRGEHAEGAGPLSTPQLEYAALDALACVRIREELFRECGVGR